MTLRWESKVSITKIRSTWPSSKFQQNSRRSSFSVFLSFVWNFEDAQILYSEMKLYIVIYIIYLREKPESVDFQGKKQFFDTKTYLKSQFSAYFGYFFCLQADGFLSNGSLIPSYFHTYNCNFVRFSDFPEKNVQMF